MTNVIIQRAKKAIPAAYIVLQGLVLLILNILAINHWTPYVFAFLASSTYLWTALSNPGYVEYEDMQQPPRPSAKSEPIIPLNPSQIQKAMNDELGGQLGVESNINNHSFEPKMEDNHVCQVGSRNSDENVKENEQQVANNIRVDRKIQKYEKVKYSKDCIKEVSKKKETIINVLDQIKPVRVVPIQLRQVTRWCNTCKNHQKLRVRHCHQCKRCVSTFDHHCPWMNNCIGQKNKFALVTFSIIQIAQLCYLIVELGSILSSSPYSRSIMLLWLVIVIITLGMAGMLTFQIYLICGNITTWEHARWSKIEYLAIFNKTKMRSLFDLGVIANIKTFFKSSWSKQPTEWITLISPVAHKYVIEGQNPTDRCMVVK